MNSNNLENKKNSILFKDFSSENEFYVREEFLIPLFECAGYGSFGPSIIQRDVVLNRDIKQTKRDHIYPDFVLSFKKFPLWIIDAKSPKIKLSTEKHIEQLTAYCKKLNCRNGILSNAIETIIYSLVKEKLIVNSIYSISEIKSGRLNELIEILSPQNTLKKVFTLPQLFNNYLTNQYVDRSMIMKAMQIFDKNAIEHLLNSNKSIIYGSNHFRNRSLPAILISPFASDSNGLFKSILDFSLNDSNPIVRENMLTCLLTSKEALESKDLFKYIKEYIPSTFLEKLFYLSTSKMYFSEDVSSLLIKNNSFLKKYSELLQTNTILSFPIALLLEKPRRINFNEYRNYLSLLPSIIEQTVIDKKTHSETYKVMKDCLSYCKEFNQSVFAFLVNKSTKKQLQIYNYLINL